MMARLLGLVCVLGMGCGLFAFSGLSSAQDQAPAAAAQPTAAVNPASPGTDKVVVTTYTPEPNIRAIMIGSVSGIVLFILLSWLKSNRQLQSVEDVRIAEESEVNEPDAPKPLYRK